MNTLSPFKPAATYSQLLFVYMLLLATQLLAIFMGWEQVRFVSKCLLMPVLLVYFLMAGRHLPAKGKMLIALALIASFAGDVFLLFDASNSLYFMLGLGSFLLAHVFYCVYLGSAYKPVSMIVKLVLILLVALYGGLLLYILNPYLNNLVWPVRVYAFVISLMMLLALIVHMAYRNPFSRLVALGACLFVISDSVLAINKFYQSFSQAGLAVMFTYGMAQVLIVRGALERNRA